MVRFHQPEEITRMHRIVTFAGVAVITTLLPPPIARSGGPVPDPAPDADAFVLRILDSQGNPVTPVPTVTQGPATSPAPAATQPSSAPTPTVIQSSPVTSFPTPTVALPVVADPSPARPMAVVTPSPSPSVIVIKPGPGVPKPHRPATTPPVIIIKPPAPTVIVIKPGTGAPKPPRRPTKTPPVIIIKPTTNRPAPAVAQPVRPRPAVKPAAEPTAGKPHRQRPQPHRDHRDRTLIVRGPDGPGILYDGLDLGIRDLLPDFCHGSVHCPVMPAQWPGLPPTVPLDGWGFGL
ncbi:hypothetical protein GCM10010112_15300 [Actinoplanes lobatus]|uniref:Uncharacterized protein n=2 Tax=Actinoplanes lobatus TaxID=113568 RepID=A0ABQ4AA73_9ACTN|nr:hypothetical protein GCM10010112_15300 [Actinoplanes lobatus]GIE37894.1 hypothetical protein Alo02nite_07920 [Actinoplanes lobatus]